MAKAEKKAPEATSTETGGLPLFFQKPALLDNKRHATASIRPTVDYGFAKNVNSVTLNAIEFIEAVKSYPIVFSQGEVPVPVAILGLEQTNQFVGQDGKWLAGHYTPAYVRQYPFIFMSQPNDEKFYLCVDEAAPQFSDKTEEGSNPIYNADGTPSDLANHALQFCTSYYQHRNITEAFCADLAKHKLLSPYSTEVKKADGSSLHLNGFQMINETLFNALSDKVFREFREKGWLPFIYLSLASASNWKRVSDLEIR